MSFVEPVFALNNQVRSDDLSASAESIEDTDVADGGSGSSNFNDTKCHRNIHLMQNTPERKSNKNSLS